MRDRGDDEAPAGADSPSDGPGATSAQDVQYRLLEQLDQRGQIEQDAQLAGFERLGRRNTTASPLRAADRAAAKVGTVAQRAASVVSDVLSSAGIGHDTYGQDPYGPRR